MKKVIILILTIVLAVFNMSAFEDKNRPDSFQFSEPATWEGRIAPRLFNNVYDNIFEASVKFPPTLFEIELVKIDKSGYVNYEYTCISDGVYEIMIRDRI